MHIGKIIKEYRLKNNITQASFGKIVGVNKQTVSKWENGTMQPSTEKYFEIAAAIKIPVDNLLMNENEHNQDTPFIYAHRTKYDVGLNSMYLSVHDFDSFCAFIDTMESAHRLLEPTSNLMGFLLIEMTYENERSHEDAIPINHIYWDGEDVVVEVPGNTLSLTRDNILRIERVASFNNETYGFNIYVKAKQDGFIQLILGFNNDSEDI